MKFGIVFAENKKFNNLEIDAGLAFKKFLLVLLFVIVFLITFGEYLGYKKIDFGINIFYYLAPLIILLLFKNSKVIFDSNIIILQSMSGIFKKEIQIGEIKGVTLDSLNQFHMILTSGKEFVFRARRISEHEDLKNQFYSVGLYKGDIRK